MNNSSIVLAASKKDDACSFSASAVKAVLNEDTNTITAVYDLQNVSKALASDHPYAAIKTASGERIDLTELFVGITDNMNWKIGGNASFFLFLSQVYFTLLTKP